MSDPFDEKVRGVGRMRPHYRLHYAERTVEFLPPSMRFPVWYASRKTADPFVFITTADYPEPRFVGDAIRAGRLDW